MDQIGVRSSIRMTCSRQHIRTPALRARVVRAHIFGRTSSGGPVGRFAGFAVLLAAYQSERSREDGRRPSSPGGRRRGGARIGTRSQRNLRSDGRKFVDFVPPSLPARPPQPDRLASPAPSLCCGDSSEALWRPYGGARVRFSRPPARTLAGPPLPARPPFFSHPPRYRCPTSCSPFACTIWHWWL